MKASGNIRGIDRSGLRGRLILVLTTITVLSVLALGAAAIMAFDRAIEPELSNRTRLIGTIIRGEIQRALDLGIPIDAIAGLEQYLRQTLDDFGEVQRIAITRANGLEVAMAERASLPPSIFDFGEAVVVSQQHFRLPILQGNRLVGNIAVEISPRFVQTRLRDVFLDVGVLALIAVLVAVELSLAVVVSSVGKPLDRVWRLLGEQSNGTFLHRIREGGLGGLARTAARLNDHAEDLAARLRAAPADLRARIDARLPDGAPRRLRLSDFNDIRLALFLFCLGTEIAAAFMPLYAQAADRPDWMTAEIAAAAPLVFYLAAIALVSTFGSRLIARFGARRLFLWSAPGGGLALIGLAQSTTVVEIAAFQGLMAGFYASATIAGQEYAIRAAGEQNRAKAVGAFVAVAYGGLFAGSALGGLIAGRFGYPAAFIVGAAFSVISIFLGMASMRGRAGDQTLPANPTGSAVAPRRSWITVRYLALLFGVSVPMNMTMVIFIWYLTPLMLAETGSGPAQIARVLVLYYFAFFLLGPTVARLADGRPGPVTLLTVGAVLSGLSVLSLTAWDGFWAIAAAVGGVGIGQVMTQAPIYAMALRINGGPGPGIDALRLVERLGAIAGLTVSAMLLDRLGAVTSLAILGIVVLTGIGLYGSVEIGRGLFSRHPEERADATGSDRGGAGGDLDRWREGG